MTNEKNIKKIEIDGVLRHISNSRGRPIASSLAELKEFWRWFSDSKAVDSDGRPVVLFHGTSRSFDDFRLTDGELGRGIYFTNNQVWATEYGPNVKSMYALIHSPIIIESDEDYSLIYDEDGELLDEVSGDGIIVSTKLDDSQVDENTEENFEYLIRTNDQLRYTSHFYSDDEFLLDSPGV
jgi:hypothetical protein